jgi:hypothetical protein
MRPAIALHIKTGTTQPHEHLVDVFGAHDSSGVRASPGFHIFSGNFRDRPAQRMRRLDDCLHRLGVARQSPPQDQELLFHLDPDAARLLHCHVQFQFHLSSQEPQRFVDRFHFNLLSLSCEESIRQFIAALAAAFRDGGERRQRRFQGAR